MNQKTLIHDSIDLTDVLTLIIQEISLHVQLFSFLDLSRISVCIASNRKNSRGGIYGKLVPLFFEGGAEQVTYRGRRYKMPPVQRDGTRQKYLIFFYMPKFFDLNPREKLRVIFHELYHISPDFNGDIRRMTRGKAAHGHSRKEFDSHFEKELNEFFKFIQETPYRGFLDLNSREFFTSFSKVKGRRMKLPKPLLVS